MPRYRRAFNPGGVYFFTVVTFKRQPLFAEAYARSCLRRAFEETQSKRPFETVALCLLPDHLHTVWSLPEEDCDFPTRWRQVKGLFSRHYLSGTEYDACGKPHPTQSSSRERRGRKAIWQTRFWEHLIRDEDDLRRHVEYIHYNPVKHGLVLNVADWPWSTFHRYVTQGVYNACWGEAKPACLNGFEAPGE